MRVSIVAVGRMKNGPERDLVARYLDRFARAGGALGLDYAGLREEAESRAADAAGRRRDEAGRLLARLPDGAALVVLDETGRALGSREFATFLGAVRDEGRRDLVLAIGGPDGFDPVLRSGARRVLSLGAMTWPHQIARLLLAEQLYRATTILSGHPYHRD